MMCPLTISARFYTGPGVEVVGGDCLKEQCAWWSPGKEHCAVFHIAASLYALGEMLEKIAAKGSGKATQ